MSEAKKVAIGVVSGVLGIAVLFALILMIVGKGDEPATRPQSIVEYSIPPKEIDVKPAADPVQSELALQEAKKTNELLLRQMILAGIPLLSEKELVTRQEPQEQGIRLSLPAENTSGTAEHITKLAGEDPAKSEVDNGSHETQKATQNDSKPAKSSPTSKLVTDNATGEARSATYAARRRKRYRQLPGPGLMDGIIIPDNTSTPVNPLGLINEMTNAIMNSSGMRGPVTAGHYCGAMTLQGTPCARWVVNGLYCYQHGG
jgi:hypothetical protein